jgi:uncharacterized protein YabN with tetrapyrrole methylase and pyrophosphatase domain
MAGKEIPECDNPFDELVELMKALRSPGGCPWDMKQTIETAVEDILSETGEVREALEKGDMENLKEELGDLLWSIVFTANIAREKHLFGIEDILRETRDKIIRRHPHVFGDAKAETPEDALRHFREAKERERHGIPEG